MSFPIFFLSAFFFVSTPVSLLAGIVGGRICVCVSRVNAIFFPFFSLPPEIRQALSGVLAGSITSEKPTGVKSLAFFFSSLGASSFGSRICQPKSIRSFSLFVFSRPPVLKFARVDCL